MHVHPKLPALTFLQLTIAKIRVISNNVRGLGAQDKRRDVIHYMKRMRCDVILLQYTHLTKEKIASFNSLWTGKAYHSCHTNNSRGVSILINRSLEHDVINEFTDSKGNYLILQCKIGTDSYLIGTIYGPNRDEPQFYEHIGEILDNADCDHIILGGDFNFVIDAVKDCYGYTRENNINGRKRFLSVCNKHNLIDIWRRQTPEQLQFTWFSPNSNKGARLDMFFVSAHLKNLCHDLQILPGYQTDHNIISMILPVGESQRGLGLWKFNESLLSDEEYVEIVNKCIFETITEYSLPIYTSDFLFFYVGEKSKKKSM